MEIAFVRSPPDENGPQPVDYGDVPRHKVPKALKRLKKQFTYDKQLAAFRQKFDRAPHSETELEVFCEFYLIEVYNSGRDEI